MVVISPSITFIALLLYLGQALRDSEADIERAIEAMAVMDGWIYNSAASISFSLSSLAASIYLGIACLFKIKGAYISRAAFPEPCVALLSSGRLRKYRAPG